MEEETASATWESSAVGLRAGTIRKVGSFRKLANRLQALGRFRAFWHQTVERADHRALQPEELIGRQVICATGLGRNVLLDSSPRS